MIKVFKTNVEEAHEAKQIIQKLLDHFPENKINFDLDDCDKILKVKGEKLVPRQIIALLNENGYQCEILI